MPENNELVNLLRSVIQEELKPVNEKLTAIEDTVNDIRATNRRTHKELFSRLDYIVDDIKRLEPHEEKAVR